MALKTIEITEHDYDRLLIQAGHPDKIKFIITAMLKLQDAAHTELLKLNSWIDAATEATATIPGKMAPKERNDTP